MSDKKRDLILSRISEAIGKNKTFFLTGHQKPDGDTVASELALASLLSRLGKKVEIYNFEPVPKGLLFLPGAEKIRTSKKVEKNYDVAVIFECGAMGRTGNIIDLDKHVRTAINIDHHLNNTLFGHINLVNHAASSNSEQLFYLFEKMRRPITQDEASCLYAGIMTDTGRFQHSNTNAETMRIASKLLERGVQSHLLCEEIYGTRSFPGLKLLGLCLSNLRLHAQGKIAVITVSQADFRRTGSDEDDLEEIVNYGLQVPTVLISLLIRAGPAGGNGTVKVSLRSRRDVDVCRLAQQFGGGGHRYASGCKVKGKLEPAAKKVLSAAVAFLNSPGSSARSH